jgi:hypothetical protein
VNRDKHAYALFSGFLAQLVLISSCVMAASWSNPALLTSPTSEALHNMRDRWDLLSYHLLLLDAKCFPGGERSSRLLLPYDSSSIPGEVEQILEEQGLKPVSIHLGTRFTLKSRTGIANLTVKGVDSSSYMDMFSYPMMIDGRWLSESGEEIVLPAPLAEELDITVGEEVTLTYGPLRAAEKQELEIHNGKRVPDIMSKLPVVGIHNSTDGMIYTGRETVDELTGSENATYINVRVPEPSDFAEINEALKPYYISGDIYPVRRKVELDSSPSLVKSPSGQIRVMWDSKRTGRNEIWIGTLNTETVTLENQTKVTQIEENIWVEDDPCGFYDPNGTLWIVFCSNRDGSQQLWATKESGGTWSAPVRITSNDTVNIQPNALDSHRDWLVWNSFTDPDDSRIQVGRIEGGRIIDSVAIPHNHTSIRHPFLSRDGRGEMVMHVSFFDISLADQESQNGIEVIRSSDGTEWSDPEVVSEGAVYDLHPSFTMDSGDESWLVWSSLRTTDRGTTSIWPNPEIWYKHTIDGEIWSTPRRLTDSWGPDFDPCLVEGGGKIWAIWYSEDEEPFGALMASYQELGEEDSNSFSLPPWVPFVAITGLLLVSVAFLVIRRPESPGETG